MSMSTNKNSKIVKEILRLQGYAIQNMEKPIFPEVEKEDSWAYKNSLTINRGRQYRKK